MSASVSASNSMPVLPSSRGSSGGISSRRSRTNTGKVNHINKNAPLIKSMLFQTGSDKFHHEVRQLEARRQNKARELDRDVHHDTHRGHKSKALRDSKITKKVLHDHEVYSTLRGGWHQPTSREAGHESARWQHLRVGHKKRNLYDQPVASHLIKSARSDNSWHSDLDRMKKSHARVEKVRNADNASLESEIPEYLKQLVDIDGDGSIDPEEMSMMKDLMNVEVRDLDGDGKISQEEIMLAKKMAGKKLLAKKFVERQNGKMWRYDSMIPNVAEKSARTQAKTIADAGNFGTLMKALRIRENRYHLSSSDLVAGCMNQGDERWSQRGSKVTTSVAAYLD